MPIKSNIQLSHVFMEERSLKGTAIKYIKFTDFNLRLNTHQKIILKKICNGYFFYSKSKKMWGFTDKGQNEVNVSNYLNEGHIPKNLIDLVDFKNTEVEREPLPFNVENFQFHFFEMHGRPLFYFENNEDAISIYINLSHWFFVEKNEIEKEFAKKIILSLVGAKHEFTSKTIDSFFTKLNSIQSNLKYNYGSNK